MSALVVFNQDWDRDTDLVLYFQYATGTTEATAAAPANFADWEAQAALEVIEEGTQTEDATQVGTASVGSGITLETDGTIIVRFPWTPTVDSKFTAEKAPKLKYDVILKGTDGNRFKLASGTITLKDSVTKWTP